MEAWKKSVLGVVTAGALLMGVGAVPAQAAEVISASNGQIIGRGTAVTGTYTVDCDFEGQRISASINVIQNTRGGRINDNSMQEEFTCPSDGQVTREYLVFARDTGYVPGPATVRVGAFYTDESGFYTGAEDVEAFAIQLRNSR
ncbi:hypothetical protein [Arthrobacter sp. NPDC093139]|uniref:hypothetical protein n=1 Tax=Arthrobacter sp. NPDC093139 TaxID=3363945 RepID=UPI0037F713E0